MINRKVYFANLKIMPYKEAWELQENIFQSLMKQKMENRVKSKPSTIPHFLLSVQHPPVFTMGKSGSDANLLVNNSFLKSKGIEFFQINRGGDITFHGPGQMVFYPLMDLDQFFTDIHKFMRLLEQAVINTLADFNIVAGRIDGLTGVWIDFHNPTTARKICAMGIRASRWITMHGIALNINNSLDYFNYIIPCGIKDKKVTSMKIELKKEVDFQSVCDSFLNHFISQFNIDNVIRTDLSFLKSI